MLNFIVIRQPPAASLQFKRNPHVAIPHGSRQPSVIQVDISDEEELEKEKPNDDDAAESLESELS